MLKNYFDTSVLVAYYYPEEKFSDVAESEIFNSSRSIISSLTLVEFYSAIAKKIRTKYINHDEAQQIINKFNIHIQKHYYKNHNLFKKHYLTAKNWLSKFDINLRTQDALHLAITYHDGFKLITADVGLAKAAKQLNIDCKFLSKTTL